MGQVADILGSPEWAQKPPLERAQAQRDLFTLSLRDNPDLATQFEKSDDAGKQAVVDDWKKQVRAKYPDAFTTDGFIWTQEKGREGLLNRRAVPVQLSDVGTEQFVADLKADPAKRSAAVKAANDIADPEQKKQMQMLLALRLGELGKDIPDELVHTGEGGKPYGRVDADGNPDPSDWRNYKVLLPAALRTGGTAVGTAAGVMLAPETGPGAVATTMAGRAAGGFAGDLAAQMAEKALGTRKEFSAGESALNTAISALPAVPIPKGASTLLRAAIRGGEGAAIGAGQAAATEAIQGEKISAPNVATAGAVGLGLGGLIGLFEPKLAALLAGKSARDALPIVQKAVAGAATEEERAALTAAQRQIEESLGIGAPKGANAAESALALSAEHPPVVKPASESAAALQQAELGTLESTLKTNQLQEPNSQPALTPGNRQIESLDAEQRASVPDENAGPELSPQAQAISDQYGFIDPKLGASLAGGASGFAAGAARDPEGDTTEERAVNRIKNGLVMGIGGAAGGYMLGRRFLTSSGATKPQTGMTVLADVDKVLTKPQGPSLASRVADVPQNLRTALITKFAPLDQVQKSVMAAAGKPMPAVPLARKFEQVAGAGGKALVDVEDFENAILPTVKGNERDFDRLLFLKRTGQRLQQDVSDAVEATRIQAIPAATRSADEVAFLASYTPDRRRVAGWDIGKVDRGLSELETIVGAQRFAELDQLAAGGFQHELDRSLQLQVSSGRISQEAYAAIKASNDFYAPFRVLRTLEDIDAGRIPPGIDTREQIVKAISGIDDGGFHLDSPTKAAAENIFNGRVLAEKNAKMLELAKLADDDPNGAFIRKLKSWEQPRREFETVNYFEDGVAKKLEVSPAVATAVKGLNPTQTGVIAAMFKRAGTVARFGATSANAAFQVRNLAFADQPRLLLMSKYGLNARDLLNPLRVPIDFTHGLLASIKSNVFDTEDGLARAFYQSGAAGSTLQDSISRLGGRFDKAPGLTHQVIDKFEDLTRVLEETTKMMGFKRGLRIEGIASLPPAQAAQKLEEIVAEVRNYAGSPDFARGGNVAKDLSMMTLFFNARVQGNVSDLSRLAGADGAKTALAAWGRIGAAVGIPAAYFWIRNHAPENAEDFKKVPQWERDNYLMMPRYDASGAPLYFTNAQNEKVREYYRLPKREATQHVANLTDAAMDFANNKDPQAVADFAVKFAENVSPINIGGRTGTERMESAASGLNPLVKVPAEVMTNRDFFRHRDVVPDSRKEASPENQYFAGSTPQGYVDAAHAMPQFVWDPLRSPLMLRHIVGGFTGGLLNQFAEDATRKGERDPRTAALAANPVGRVFVRSQTNDTGEESQLAKDALRGAKDRSVSLDNAAAAELDKLAKLAPAEKEARVNEIERTQPELLDALADEFDARSKNLTQPDRLARKMPVRDGTRARYIVERIKRLPLDKREAFFEDQVKKGIVTDEVIDQLAELMGAGKN